MKCCLQKLKKQRVVIIINLQLLHYQNDFELVTLATKADIIGMLLVFYWLVK